MIIYNYVHATIITKLEQKTRQKLDVKAFIQHTT